MSATLYWKPVSKENNSLSDELKFALRKKYNAAKVVMGYGEIPYLEGLLHAGIEDAKDLIDAIEQHEEVEVWESY